ncbi:MAG TPA: prenyltransferase [Anaerolineales bacterium]|nr:prenyltransferase [Anaerolineales bacterium]
MDLAMWRRALQVIPRISKDEWDQLDLVSKWLISSRAAVLIMTFISAAIAGILAYQHGKFHLGYWLLLTLGLIFSHATNNLFNDFTDYIKGVNKDNYFRAQYGPQPLEHGLLTKRELLTYALVTGLLALAAGAILVYARGWIALLLLVAGAFFVLFYTFPLKYIGLGEIAVLIVWGPLMIGGGYFVITGAWDWNVVLASLPYALGVTTVIFGKHIDKYGVDKTKRIFTLPVVIGERTGRMVVICLTLLQYISVLYLVLTRFFSPVLLLVFLAIPTFVNIFLPMYRKPKPEERPETYPADAWPLWFVASAFVHNRRFGLLYLVGLILDTLVRLLF